LIEEIKDIASILKYVCEQITREMDMNTSFTPLNSTYLPLFRDFWIYMTLVILPTGASSVYSSSVWPRDWLSILSSIASASPVLLLEDDKKHLEATLMSQSIFGSVKIPDQVCKISTR
jgi:hypothetical protein